MGKHPFGSRHIDSTLQSHHTKHSGTDNTRNVGEGGGNRSSSSVWLRAWARRHSCNRSTGYNSTSGPSGGSGVGRCGGASRLA